MENKRTNILFFSLLTLVVCNNVKAMDPPKRKKVTFTNLFPSSKVREAAVQDHCQDQLSQCEQTVTGLQDDVEANRKTIKTHMDEAEEYRGKFQAAEETSITANRKFEELSKQYSEATGDLKTAIPLLEKYQTFGQPTVLKKRLTTLEEAHSKLSTERDNFKKNCRQLRLKISGDEHNLGLEGQLAQKTLAVSKLTRARDELSEKKNQCKSKHDDLFEQIHGDNGFISQLSAKNEESDQLNEETETTSGGSYSSGLRPLSSEKKLCFDRCTPYFCGAVVTIGFDYLFSCFEGTRLGNNEHFKLIHKSTKDNKKLQILSLGAARLSAIADKPHALINSWNEKIAFNKQTPIRFGLENVAGETINAILLRYCLKFIAPRSQLITDRLITNRVKSNPFVKQVGKLASHWSFRPFRLLCLLKKPCQDATRSATIRGLWILEKCAVQKLSQRPQQVESYSESKQVHI